MTSERLSAAIDRLSNERTNLDWHDWRTGHWLEGEGNLHQLIEDARTLLGDVSQMRTELATTTAREAKLREALTAAVADIEALREWAAGKAGYLFVHGFKPTDEEAATGQRIIRNTDAARALLAEPDTTSGEASQ